MPVMMKTRMERFLDNIQCEARIVARRIKELLSPDEEGRVYSVWDKSRREYRPVTYRDIVILLRTTKSWSDVFTEELGMMGTRYSPIPEAAFSRPLRYKWFCPFSRSLITLSRTFPCCRYLFSHLLVHHR